MSRLRRAARFLADLPVIILLLIAALLPGCSIPISADVPKEVKVRVSTSCVDPATRPKRPSLRQEDDLMAMDRNRRTLAAYSDLKKHEIYATELEAVVEACARVPAP